jgi:hypothetical protein
VTTPTNKAVREALEYYANGTHIKQGNTDGYGWGTLSVENGGIAKQALSLLDAETAGVGGDETLLLALSDIAESIELEGDPMAAVIKHKAAIDRAYCYAINGTTPAEPEAEEDATEALDSIVTAYCMSLGMKPPIPDPESQTAQQVRTIRAALSKPPVTGIPATDLQPDADKTGVV